jgi:hypothetical protein
MGTMPMEAKTFEGIWEDVVQLGPELTGKRVRLTVLPDASPMASLDSALAKLIEEAEILTTSLPYANRVPSTDAWKEEVIEKFRRQGFDL